MHAPPGRGLRQTSFALLFFFSDGILHVLHANDFPIQVSPQWIKSADRTVVEVTNLVMQADTSGDGLLDTQEITVGADPGDPGPRFCHLASGHAAAALRQCRVCWGNHAPQIQLPCSFWVAYMLKLCYFHECSAYGTFASAVTGWWVV